MPLLGVFSQQFALRRQQICIICVSILQSRPVKHDLLTTTCVFPWLLNELKDIFNASKCFKVKRLKSYWFLNSYLIHILDEKTIQNGTFHWVTFHLIQKHLLLYLTQILKAMLKMHINSWNYIIYVSNSIVGYDASKFIPRMKTFLNIC